MALKIRLARGGSKKRPFYHVVIADARAPRDGRFVEKVGTYNPLLAHENPERIRLKTDRIQYWLSVGAQPTDRVHLFLAKADLMAAPVIHPTPKQSAPKAKAQERVKAEEAAREEKAAAAAQAEAEAAQKAAEPEVVEEEAVVEEAAPVEEAPAEEPAAAEEAAPEVVEEAAPVADAPAEEAASEEAAE